MSSSAGPSIITNSLVLHLDAADRKSYPGSGTVWRDRSGNGINGTLTNGPTFSGSNAGFLTFDGSDDSVIFNDPVILKNQNFTISIWINPKVQNNAVISMIDLDHGLFQGWVLQSEDATTNRNFYFAWYDGSQFQPTLGGSYGAGKGIQITTLVWQNIVYSKNGTSLLGYKDGIQIYTGTATSSNVSYQLNRNLKIGGMIQIGNRQFKGDIPSIQIYNRALSDAEIKQNFNATKSRFGLL